MLRPGVTVSLPPEAGEEPRIWLSRGLERTSGAVRIPYADRAVTPRPPWRPPREDEARILLHSGPPAEGRQGIAVLRLPGEVTRTLRSIGLDAARSKADLDRVKARPDYPAAMEPVRAFVRSLSDSEETLVWHELHCSPPGLLTVTPTFGELRLAGMHVDHWDGLSIDHLGGARNRVCINLGTEDRFFLFVNLQIDEIRRMIAERSPGREAQYTTEDHQRNMESLVVDFCDLFPRYPVVKLRVGPDEAYVAPTESIIHDGSTEGRSRLDIDLMVRGHFRLSPGGPSGRESAPQPSPPSQDRTS